MTYESFLASKALTVAPVGFAAQPFTAQAEKDKAAKRHGLFGADIAEAIPDHVVLHRGGEVRE